MGSFSKFNVFLIVAAVFILAFQLPVVFEKEAVVPVQDSIFSSGISRGKLQNAEVKEASGLAASWNNPKMLWAHNDSGNKPSVFLMREDGTHVGEYALENQDNRDWEDIAAGPGPVQGKNYLYVGNIGDNLGQYNQIFVLRFEEPQIPADGLPLSQTIPASEIEVLTFEYPDGPRDAETLLLDPLTKDLYIVSKREDKVRVYRAPFPQSTKEPVILERVGELPFTWITGGDISADGQEILLKTYEQVYYWKRKPGQSIAEVFREKPRQLPYKREPQGEAIAWKADGSGFFTTSELFAMPDADLYFYERLKD